MQFSQAPYFDDFDKNKHYHKILFKPGFPVQARELNQLQSILQEQLSRLGNHIFKNGSVVIPGDVKFDLQNARYVVLDDNANSPTFRTDLVGKTLIQDFTGSQLRARVQIVEKYFDKWVAGIVYQNSATKESNGELVNIIAFDKTVPIAVDGGGFNISIPSTYHDDIPSTGMSSFASVSEGIYYVDGYFVHVNSQSIFVEPFSSQPTIKVGFVVQKFIVEATDDETLLDNAIGTPNEAAPGADRFGIDMIWTTRLPGGDEDVSDFIEILSFEKGRLRSYRANSEYATLADTLARRTYDESGDYAVRGFNVQVFDHLEDDLNYGLKTAAQGGDDNLLAVEIGPGKGYVKGYEVENFSNLYLEVDKARTENCVKFSNDTIQFNEVGEYVYLAPGNHFFDLSRHPIIWLTDGVENTSEIIGYCIPKTLQDMNLSGFTLFKLFGSFYFNNPSQAGFTKIGGWKIDDLKNGPILQIANLYNVTGGNYPIDSNALTSHPGYTPIAYDSVEKRLFMKRAMGSPIFDTTKAVVKSPATGYVKTMSILENGTNLSGDLVKLNLSNIKTLKNPQGSSETQVDASFSVIITTNSSGVGSYLYGGDGVFVGKPLAADVNNDTAFYNSLVTITAAGKQLSINNATQANKTLIVTGSIRKTLAVKSKTLTEGTTTIPLVAAGEIVLKHKDIFKLKAVYMSANFGTAPAVTDTDVADRFELVSGQTLDFYTNDSLKLKKNAALPTGQILVVYDYFLHGSGDVTTVDSYATLRVNPNDETDTTHIGKIPEFKYEMKSYKLADYLDFRPLVSDGFFIIKAYVTSGSKIATVYKDYRNVIETGSKLWAKGLATETTITNVTVGTIVSDINFDVSGDVYLIVNTAASASVIEPFNGADNIYGPVFGTSIQFDAQYFVERNDRVIITKTGEIKYLYGVPGTGKYPEVPMDSMGLAKLVISPYTTSAKYVKYSKDDNRRYTMRDIGKLEKRIETLEYYTSLTLKELDTKNMKITDAETGLDRFKSGFFVEDFRDMGVSKIYDDNFRATIDPTLGILKPFSDACNVDLKLNVLNSSNFQNTNGMITLPYVDAVAIEQPYATKSLTVNPYLVIDWSPNMKLTPDVDRWLETQWEPTITNVVNLTQTVVNTNVVTVPTTLVNESTALIFDAQTWWERPSQTIESRTTTTASSSVSESSSVQNSSSSSSSTRILGTSVIPYMRANVVRFKVTGLKPETKYWAVFDGEKVDSQCRPVNPTTQVLGTYGQDLVSDAMGNLLGDLSIKNNFYLSGTKTFCLTDVDLIVEPDSGWECQVSANYTSQGTLETRQNVITEERVTTNIIDRTVTNNEVTRVDRQTNIYVDPTPTVPATPTEVAVVQSVGNTMSVQVASPKPETVPAVVQPAPSTWSLGHFNPNTGQYNQDPVAQSWDTYEHPTGMFLTKLGLFFRKKDSTAPIQVEIRRMSQGIPCDDPIKNGIVVIPPSAVHVSEDSTVETEVRFDHPLFLDGSSEYCFVVKSNSSHYHLWVSRMGEKVVNEERIIGKQPSLGSLFKSQNGKTWTPEQMEDVKFKLYRAKFDISVLGNVSFERTGTSKLVRLPLDRFSTTSGSKIVSVFHKNHGMQLNELISFFPESATADKLKSPLAEELLNGIPASDLYGDLVVKGIVDIDNYNVEVNTSATKSGVITDSERYVWANGNFNYNKFQLFIDNIQYPNCATKYQVHQVAGKDFDGSQSAGVALSPRLVNVGDVIQMQEVGLIENNANESGTSSFRVETTFSSTDDKISPVFFDSTGCLMLTGAVINKPVDNTESTQNSGSSASKYYSQVVNLKSPATSLRFYTTESKQEDGAIELYYRVSSDLSIESKGWTYVEPVASALVTDLDKYIEHEYKVDDVSEFTNFQVKIVLKGTNSAKYPSIQDLRVIAVN